MGLDFIKKAARNFNKGVDRARIALSTGPFQNAAWLRAASLRRAAS
jgi:hypothetical protein